MKDNEKPALVSDSKDIGDKILGLSLPEVLSNIRDIILLYGENALRLEPNDEETPLDNQIRLLFQREETNKEKRRRLRWEKYWALPVEKRREFDRRETARRRRKSAKVDEKRERQMYERLKKKYGRK